MRRGRDEKLCRDIGLWLYSLRNKKDLEVKEVAIDLKLNPRTIRKFESGLMMPRIETLIELADYYGATMDYIVGRGKNESLESRRSRKL